MKSPSQHLIINNQNQFMSLIALRSHFWLEPANRIGRLTNTEMVFTQRTYLENLFKGNGNKAKRKLGIDPKHNRCAPWIKLAFTY